MHFGRLRKLIAATILSCIFLLSPAALSAPIIGLDMDPATPGVQTSLSTTVGSAYMVDVVAWDDTLPPFSPLAIDTVAVDVVSTSAITSFAGSAIAGPFVGLFSGGPLPPPPPPPPPAPHPGVPMLGGAFDLIGGAPISGGSPLVAGGAPGLTGGLSYSTLPLAGPGGALGVGSGILGASLAGPTPANTFFSVLMSITFSADTVGVTSLSVVDLLTGTSGFGALAYLPALPPATPPGYLGATSFTSTLTITSARPSPSPAPEPGTLFLLALGILGFRKLKPH